VSTAVVTPKFPSSQVVPPSALKKNRIASWKENIKTIHTYTFDTTVSDVEFIPIESTLQCLNCQGKIVHFEYRDLIYNGKTRPAISPESFGNQMKIEWEDGYDWAKVYQQITASDKLIIRYRPQDDDEIYRVRMFDPTTSAPTLFVYNPLNGTTLLFGTNSTVNVSYYSTHTLNHTFEIKIFLNTTIPLYSNLTYQNGSNDTTFVEVPIGAWNFTVTANVSNVSVGNINTTIIYLEVFDPNPLAPKLTVYAPEDNTFYLFGTNATINVSYLATHTINNTFEIKIFLNTSTNLFSNLSYTNGSNDSSLVDVPPGSWNLTVSANVSNGTLSNVTSKIRYVVVANASVDLVIAFHPGMTVDDLKNAFCINATKITEQLNFSNPVHFAGNYSYNFTENNITSCAYNYSTATNVTEFLYNLSSNGTHWNITVLMKVNQTKDWYELHCTNRYLNITTVNVEIVNLTPGEHLTVNCTMNLLNVSQTFSNWTISINRAVWDFNETFNHTVLS